jgi:hypothetical protein
VICRTAQVSLALLLLIASCGDSRNLPPVDVRYSEFLSVLGENYTAISGSAASTTVGVVQMGRGRQSVADLAEATRGEVCLRVPSTRRDRRVDLRDPEHEPTQNPSCDLGNGATWIVVAHDSALFRTGVIRLYACGEGEETVVGVTPAGDAGITYSREAVGVLRSLG